jgi:hypothetical protein
MSSGGGGQSGDTTYNWNPSMQPRWDNLLNLSERAFFPQGVDGSYPDLSTFKPYTAQRFTGPTYNERQAMANTSSMADVAPSPFSYTDIAGNNHTAITTSPPIRRARRSAERTSTRIPTRSHPIRGRARRLPHRAINTPVPLPTLRRSSSRAWTTSPATT